MEEKEKLKNQVVKVMKLLEKRIEDDPNSLILKTLYGRYEKAKRILLDNENIEKIMIKGGCRAYLDAFSDYMNPLLIEMDIAETLLLELKK